MGFNINPDDFQSILGLWRVSQSIPRTKETEESKGVRRKEWECTIPLRGEISNTMDCVIGPDGANPLSNKQRFRGKGRSEGVKRCFRTNPGSTKESKAPESTRAGTEEDSKGTDRDITN